MRTSAQVGDLLTGAYIDAAMRAVEVIQRLGSTQIIDQLSQFAAGLLAGSAADNMHSTLTTLDT